MKTKILVTALLLGAHAASAQEPAALPSKSDAEKILKADKVSKGGNISRLAITSCNVLFANETSANAETQRGFGDSTAKRVESRIDATYTMQGMDAATLQALATQICADASAQLGAAGYTMVPAAEVAARPEFAKLHAKGKPVPYAYERNGTKYTNYAPPGEQVIDLNYLSTRDVFGAAFSAMSATENPAIIEGTLLNGLQASGAHINVMVDFAKPTSNSVKGFFGKIAGSDTAKVEAKMQLSISGLITLIPLEYIDCGSGYCIGASDASKAPRFTSKAPLVSGANAVLDVVDIQSKAEKGGELAVNAMATVIALSGYSSATTSIERNGVVVDPTIYQSEVRRMAREFVGMAAVLAKP
ncbi:MAG: hypothetical protein Q7J29_05120 [Stagnimonas sp.]|nr:hypothetical protein [Stagnimonas sp.]